MNDQYYVKRMTIIGMLVKITGENVPDLFVRNLSYRGQGLKSYNATFA